MIPLGQRLSMSRIGLGSNKGLGFQVWSSDRFGGRAEGLISGEDRGGKYGLGGRRRRGEGESGTKKGHEREGLDGAR